MLKHSIAMMAVLAVLRVLSLVGSWGIGIAEDCPANAWPTVCKAMYDTAYVLTLIGY